MSHHSIAEIWAQLEKRADLTTILRDAVGQYALQAASCDKNYSSSDSIRAFNRLINVICTAFHLQRIYLQPRQPSPNIESFLIEPSLVIEILVFLLTVKDDCISVRQDLGFVEERILRSIGAVLLAGLRLLTLHKSKVTHPTSLEDWASIADRLKKKLANWPLGGSVHRILIGELCTSFLLELSTTAEVPLTGSIKPLCKHHEDHPGAVDDVDLPDFNDGLYPLKVELRDVVSRAINCIGCQCPWWFQSFCAWYDIWSALIGAFVQIYHKGASDEILCDFGFDFVQNWECASNNRRFAAIHETFFTLNPFPQCNQNECRSSGLQHSYQELQCPGVWQENSKDAIDLQLRLTTELQTRKHSLRDADEYVQQLAKSTRESITDWALFPEGDTLEIGQLETYIINCPELHPLTSQSLKHHLESKGREDAAELVQNLEKLVRIDGLPCPWCTTQPFTQARLIEPLSVLDKRLNDAPLSSANLQESSLKIKRPPNGSKRVSTSSRSLRSSSSRSFLTLPVAPFTHSRKGSSENASQGSSKGKLSSIFKSSPSPSRLPILSGIFTDGKFVLAWTSNRVSCYDCELETWSKGHSFPRVAWVAGSSVRYAVVSKDTHTHKLTVFRRDHLFEEEEWSREGPSKTLEKQPLSIAFSRQGHRVALGFEKGVQLFDGMTGDFETLASGNPLAGLLIESQSLSFCLCGNHLVVASWVTGKGKVFTIVHDLQPLQRQDQRIPELMTSTSRTGEFGLSSVVYDHESSTICICSSGAQKTWLIDRNHPTDAFLMTRNKFDPFPGEQIQCAVVVDSIVPQIAMVNHSNKVFILRFENGRWKSYPVKVQLEHGHGEIVRADEKMSIAAMDNGIVRLFWIHGREGGMLTINTEADEFDEDRLFLSTKILMPF